MKWRIKGYAVNDTNPTPNQVLSRLLLLDGIKIMKNDKYIELQAENIMLKRNDLSKYYSLEWQRLSFGLSVWYNFMPSDKMVLRLTAIHESPDVSPELIDTLNKLLSLLELDFIGINQSAFDFDDIRVLITEHQFNFFAIRPAIENQT